MGRAGKRAASGSCASCRTEWGPGPYDCCFSDGTPGKKGTFACTKQRARPGPLRPDPDNRHWFVLADGFRTHLHGYYYHDYWSDFDAAWKERAQKILLADDYTLVMSMSYIRQRPSGGTAHSFPSPCRTQASLKAACFMLLPPWTK